VKEGLAPTTKHWHKKTSACEVCNEKFKSRFSKHHCRACGKCVCSSCSSFKDYFETLDKKQRICAICVNESQDQLLDLWNRVLDEESAIDDVIDLTIRKAKACNHTKKSGRDVRTNSPSNSSPIIPPRPTSFSIETQNQDDMKRSNEQRTSKNSITPSSSSGGGAVPACPTTTTTTTTTTIV